MYINQWVAAIDSITSTSYIALHVLPEGSSCTLNFDYMLAVVRRVDKNHDLKTIKIRFFNFKSVFFILHKSFKMHIYDCIVEL